MAIEECNHDNVIWGPVEIDYGPDGLAGVSQNGTCSCDAKLNVGYDFSLAEWSVIEV
jgi:hypothetical protein